MIYGPYKRKSRIQAVRMPQRIRHRSYNARPSRAVFSLRIVLAVCAAALLILGGRALCLEHTALELSVTAALAGIAVLLLYLLKRMDHRRN